MAEDTTTPWKVTHRGVVHAWMCDHYGHLNVRYYAHLFDDASWVMWSVLGVGTEALKALGVHTVVARTETDMRKELTAGTIVEVRSRVVRIGSKSVTYEQELRGVDTDTVHATQRAVEVFFDPNTRTSAPVPDSVRATLVASST
jgi:acyl-CoA thioester hydrolase